MDLLKFQAFPELAAALRAQREAIVQRWQAAVEETLPQAHTLTLTQLRNDLPVTLEQMSLALEATDPRATKDLMDVALNHGEVRFDQNFNLGELMIEFSLLRPILIDEITRGLGRIVSIEEIIALNLGVDIAARRSVVSFVNQQKAELQALVEAQTKYLSFLSHDLRGGLNGVLLMLEVLRRDLADEPKFGESLNDLEVMRRSILETVGTMDRFLHAERFRKGKVQVRLSQVNLHDLIASLANQFSYSAKEKDLKLEMDVPAEAQVSSDAQLINLILQNLIGNAIKYSKRGTIRITATDSLSWKIAVQDQGPGIAQDKLSTMFHHFTRGDTHGQAGTGLGLSIAKQAADLLSAKLWAESQLGVGSTFFLELPVHMPEKKPA
ncbi:MAG TPA: sensor histidine kinase [Tepidisphaeraceae bacterium]